ncbi:MAG TPA: glycosyltransferase family 4 protein [Mycobacteriales bacterium]|nr:glycosyltransferase family 4 protein [Mycobacteriales bacterium]
MRILTINNGYPPHYYGGYELWCAGVVDRFMAAGHDVMVLTSDVRVPGVTAPDPDGPEIRRLLRPYWDWERGGPAVPRTPFGRYGVERDNLAALNQAIADFRPDVVSVWHMNGLSMSLLTRLEELALPMVVVVGNDFLMQAPEFDAWTRMFDNVLGRRLRRIGSVPVALPRMDGATFSFISDYTKQQSLGRSRFPVPTGSPVVFAGLDTVDFPPVELEEATSKVTEWGWSILYVGRLDPVKGVETLLHAAARVDQAATVRLDGRGSPGYLEKLRQLAADLGIAERVTFACSERAELRERYRLADVVVFPSQWGEPFGLVPLESMACGTPVIASGTGGAAEFLVDGENCRLFKVGDAEDLTRALLEVADDPALRATLVRGGLTTARTITVDRCAQELLVLHRAAAAASARH